jgi:hypothetical protein
MKAGLRLRPDSWAWPLLEQIYKYQNNILFSQISPSCAPYTGGDEYSKNKGSKTSAPGILKHSIAST